MLAETTFIPPPPRKTVTRACNPNSVALRSPLNSALWLFVFGVRCSQRVHQNEQCELTLSQRTHGKANLFMKESFQQRFMLG